MRADQLEQELRAFQIQSELQYKYYEDMERKYRESRKILHDMKNHLQAVESLYREGAGSNADEESRGNRYVKDLYHMVNMLGEKFYSSNHMLNIICNDKLSAARRRGIRVVAEIGDVDFSDLKDIDITTIFANLLDNATDAAAESGQDRFIEMKIQEIQNFRVISIINSIPEQRLLTYEPGKVDRSAQPDRQGRSIDADQQGIPAEHLVMHALAGGGTANAVPQGMGRSLLRQWPVQIRLAPASAPYFEGADLLIAADCTAYAYGSFHEDFIRGRVTLIGCPKLDAADYSEKLTEIFRRNSINSITVARMEVPCCGGIEYAVKQAVENSGREIPTEVKVITTEGEFIHRKEEEL